MNLCFRCGSEWNGEQAQPYFHATCAECETPLHVCRNCTYYEETLPNKCRIPNTEWVADREKDNYCEEFEFCASQRKNDTSHRARRVFDSLFQADAKQPEPARADAEGGSADTSARRAFEQLFGS